MVNSKEHRIFSRGFAQADSSNDDNIIRNVSIITKGEAQGHACQIDDETLLGLLAASKRFKNGVRANLGHFTGIENSFGHVTDLRMDGEKLVGDLNLFPEHQDFALIKRNIKTIPDTFGFSVFFDGPDEEKEEDINGVKIKVPFARCDENKFYSIDLVTEPAANPSGLFQKGKSVDTKKSYMATVLENPEDLKTLIKDCVTDCMKSHAEHMDEISGKVDAITKKVEAIGTNDTPVKTDEGAADLLKKEGETKDSSPGNPGSGKMDKEPDKEKMIDEKEMSRRIEANNKALSAEITNGVLKALSDQKISPPASATAGSPASETAPGAKPKYKTYHEACRAIHALGKNTKTESMKLACEQNPDLYRAYTKGQENGEAWTREPLFTTEEKKQRNLSIIASGRLI